MDSSSGQRTAASSEQSASQANQAHQSQQHWQPTPCRRDSSRPRFLIGKQTAETGRGSRSSQASEHASKAKQTTASQGHDGSKAGHGNKGKQRRPRRRMGARLTVHVVQVGPSQPVDRGLGVQLGHLGATAASRRGHTLQGARTSTTHVSRHQIKRMRDVRAP